MSPELGESSTVVGGDCRRKPEEEPGRAGLAVRLPGLIVFLFGACWLSGCGAHGVSLAASEQTALGLLRNSTIARRVFALSDAADEAPTTCLIQPVAGTSDRFQLFVTWKPTTVIAAQMPQSVLVASVSDKSASQDSFQVATYKNRFGKPVSLSPGVIADFDRASLDQSASQCVVLDNGQLELASAEGS